MLMKMGNRKTVTKEVYEAPDLVEYDNLSKITSGTPAPASGVFG